jgi:hypothetical protein
MLGKRARAARHPKLGRAMSNVAFFLQAILLIIVIATVALAVGKLHGRK